MSEIDNLIAMIETQLSRRQPEGHQRLAQKLNDLRSDFNRRRFFHAFALCSRWFDKQANMIDFNEMNQWREQDPYGVLQNWQYPHLARLLVLLSVSQRLTRDEYIEAVNELFKTADVNELILLGRSLAFLPEAELFIDRARENARSNIAPVFSSVAHYNEYALRFFDKGAWNQLVLKAAFLAEPIWNIPGLKRRNNAELVTMLRHYVEERQAAARSVPWDLWCCIGWRAQGENELEELRRQWEAADGKSRAAIALALTENPDPAARAAGEQLLSNMNEPADRLSWPAIAEQA